MGDHLLRIGLEYFTVSYLNLHRKSAIQAGGFYFNRLSREKPADRQRFKGSLPEPFLLALDGDPVLGGKIIERRERGNIIGMGKNPARHPSGKEFVKDLSSFFHGDPKLIGQLRIKWGLTCFDHSLQDEVKGFFENRLFSHNASSPDFFFGGRSFGPFFTLDSIVKFPE